MYSYSPENARLYSELGVTGTTYEVSFNEMARLLGNLHGKIVLDFGTGTGRSAQLLHSLGATKVIGVDHDTNMINEARKKVIDGIEFHEIKDGIIPLTECSVDAVVSAHVFVEMKTKEEMIEAANEIARVLKPDGIFILISTNPKSIGHEFISYVYKRKDNLKSGDSVTCIVKGTTSFQIDDTYWTEVDYNSVMKQAGFKEIKIMYPTAEGPNWQDETIIAPDIVLLGLQVDK